LEIIAENLKKRGWSYGYVSAIDSKGRTIWIADAHRDGKRFVLHADEKLRVFLELESAIPRSRCSSYRAMPVRRYLTFPAWPVGADRV